MKAAAITLCKEGGRVALALAGKMPACEVYVHRQVSGFPETVRFDRIAELTADLFHRCDGLIFIVPCGVAVRAIAPQLRDKHTDPAVVVIDVAARWVISLLSGHEGGANDLAVQVANSVDAEPVISTTTEAVKRVIVGVGCRQGVAAERIESAIRETLERAKVALAEVRLLASADMKQDEPGLIDAARALGIPLRFVGAARICRSSREFARSDFVQQKVGLPAVAEPAALLAGVRTELFVPRQTFQGVTIALAREDCLWSA